MPGHTVSPHRLYSASVAADATPAKDDATTSSAAAETATARIAAAAAVAAMVGRSPGHPRLGRRHWGRRSRGAGE